MRAHLVLFFAGAATAANISANYQSNTATISASSLATDSITSTMTIADDSISSTMTISPMESVAIGGSISSTMTIDTSESVPTLANNNLTANTTSSNCTDLNSGLFQLSKHVW